MEIKRVDLNEEYGLGVETPLKMFLHGQEDEMKPFNEKLPAMVVVPGGGYGFTSEREADPIALEYFIRHYNAFVVRYAVAPSRYPTALTQVACAVDYVKKHAAELNVDENKVFAVGFSAGGHLTGCLANFCDDLPVPEAGGKKLDARPAGVVLSYPVITPHSHEDSFKNLLGITNVDCPEAEALSLDKTVTAANPPCFIWATVTDACVDPIATLLYTTALHKNKVKYECHIFPEGPHGLATCNEETYVDLPTGCEKSGAWIELSDKFLKSLK